MFRNTITTLNVSKIVVPVGVALAAFAAFSSEATALGGYTVRPLIIDEQAEARDILKETVIITNNNDHKVELFPSVNNVTLGNDGTIEEFVSSSMVDRTSTLSSWIEVSRGVVELAPGETKEIPLTIRINPNAEIGEYHAIVGFGEGSIRDQAEKRIKSGIGERIIVTIRIEEEVNAYLELKRFFSKAIFVNTDRAKLNYELTNTGNQELLPKGEIIIYNRRGQEVSAAPVNNENAKLLPNNTISLSSVADIGSLFGRYKAFLNLEYGDTQKASVQDTIYFYVIPWQRLLIIFVTLLALVLAAVHFLHRRYAHVDNQQEVFVESVVTRKSRPSKKGDIDMKQ